MPDVRLTGQLICRTAEEDALVQNERCPTCIAPNAALTRIRRHSCATNAP